MFPLARLSSPRFTLAVARSFQLFAASDPSFQTLRLILPEVASQSRAALFVTVLSDTSEPNRL